MKLKESKICLTENEKQSVKEEIKDIQFGVNADPNKVEKLCTKYDDRSKKFITRVKNFFKDNGVPDEKYPEYYIKSHMDDFSIGGIFRTIKQWIKELIMMPNWKKLIASGLLVGIIYWGFTTGVYYAISELFNSYPVLTSGLSKLAGLVNINQVMIPQFIRTFIMLVFACPIAEESMKFIAQDFNLTKEFWGLFNLHEFFRYTIYNWEGSLFRNIAMFDYKTAIISLPVQVFNRILAVMMHTTTTKILADNQSKIKSKDLRFVIGILCHMLWNFVYVCLGGTAIVGVSYAMLGLTGFLYVYKKLLRKKTGVNVDEPANVPDNVQKTTPNLQLVQA